MEYARVEVDSRMQAEAVATLLGGHVDYEDRTTVLLPRPMEAKEVKTILGIFWRGSRMAAPIS